MSHDVQQVRSFEHPGEGRKRAKSTPKGRQIDPAAAHEIELLLGDRPRRRDLLIEHLHLIQDTYHQISAAHLAALADEMKLAFAEVFETATFYAHFDVVKEGEPDIAPLTIRVCDSITCAMFGAEQLLQELQRSAGPDVRPASVCATWHLWRRLAIATSFKQPRPKCWRRPRAARPIPKSRPMSTTTPM
jgi:formate dehydrogenase